MSEFLPKPAKLPESVLDELQAKVLGYYRNAAAGQPIGPLPAPAEPTEPTDVMRQTPYTREPVQTILPSDKGLTAALDGLEAKVRARQPAPAAGATQDIAPVLTPAEPPLSEPAKRAIQGALTALEWHKTAARWASLGQEKEAERKRGEEEAYQVYVKGSEQRAGEGDYERQKAMARDRGPQGAGTPALKLARGMPEPTQDEVANWPKEAGVLVRTKMKALEKEGALDEIASLSQKYRGAAILSQRRGVGGAGVEILEKQLIDPLTSAAASAITFSGNPIWAAWEFAGLMAEDAPQPRAERLENFIRGIPRSGAEFTVTTVKQTIKGLVNPDNIVEFGLTVGAALFYLRIGWKVGKTGVRIATAVRDRLVKAGVDRKVAAATARAASATLSGPKPGIGGPEQVVQQLAENLAKELGAKNPLFNEARAFILSPEGKGYVGNVVRSWHAPSTSRGLALPAPTTPTGMRYLYSGVALPPEVVTALTKLNVTAVVREGVAALSGVTPKTVAGVGAIMAQAGMTFNPATNTAVPQAGAEKAPAAPPAPAAPREPSTRLPLPSQIEPTVTEVRERTALKERLATHKKVAEAAFREGKAGGSERTAAERDLIRRESERRIKLAALKGRLREQVRTQVARERVAELLAQKKDRQANAETALVIVKEIIGPDAELLESNDYKILRERIFGTKKFMRVATIEQVHETMAWAEQLLDKAETGALRHLVAGQLRDLGTAQKSMEEPYRSEARRLLAAYQRAEPAGPKVGELESRREYVTRTKESAEVGGEQFNPELLMPTKYLEELRRLGQKPISELSREELTVLSDGIEWNEMGSKRLATARAGAERLGLENRADAAVEEMRRARPEPLPEHKIPGTLGQRAKGLEDTLGTISHDIPTLHDAVTTKLFEAENNTAGVKIELLNALVAVLERPFGGNVLKAHKFMGKLLTVLTPGTDRRSVTRSVADWMTFYVDSMANRFEMLKSGYTFRPSQQKGVTGPNEVETAARPWLVTQETIDAVARQLPRAAKQMADGLLAEIFNRPGLWERSEAAFFAVKGRHREAAAVYAPRRRSGLQRPSQQLMPGEVATEFFLDSLPQFQERTGSSLSLVGDPILGRALSFIEATSRMIGEGAAVRETAVLLGLPSVRAEMISRYGQPVYDNMTALVAHGANEGLAPTGDVIDRWFRGGARRFTDAVLSWNPSTGFVQIPSSILYNLNEFLGAKQYAQAVAQVGRHPLRFYKEMIANVPMAALRYHVLSADIQGLMTGTPEPALALRVKRRFAKVGMKHLLAGDAIALTIGYRGFVLEAAARGLGLDWAARQFVTTTNETQLSASRFNRTPLQVKARESPALTGLSLFRNQLAVNRNLLVRAIENARNEPGGERGRANWRNLFKTVGLLVAQQLAIAFIHSGFAYLRSGGDKEKLKLRWILRDAALGMAGISVLGRELVGIALQLIQFDKRGVRVDVLGSPVVQALNRTAQGIVGLVRAPFVEGTYGPGATYAGESKAKIALLDAADGLAYGLGGLTGTPISPYTYTKAALKWTSLGARDLVLRLTASSLAPEDALSIADQLRSRGYSLERAQKWLASHDEKYKLTFHDMAQRELRLEKRWHATPESQAEELEFKQLKREQRKIE